MTPDLPSLLKHPRNGAERLACFLLWLFVVGGFAIFASEYYREFVAAWRGEIKPRSWVSIFQEINMVVMLLSLALSFSPRLRWRSVGRFLIYPALGLNLLMPLWPRLSAGAWQWLSALSPIFSSIGLMLLLMAFMPPQFRPWRLASKPVLIGVALALIILPMAVPLLTNQEASSRNGDLSSQLSLVLIFIGVALLVVAALPPQYTARWRVPRPLSIFAGVVILALAVVLPEFMLNHAPSGRSSSHASPKGATSAPDITPLEKVKEQNQIQLKDSEINWK
jgi:hypothetical protein